MKILPLFLIIVLTACGSGDGGSDSAPQTAKSLFSLWHHTDSEASLDLTDASFDDFSTMQIYFSPHMVCTCELTLTGRESSGSFQLNNCLLTEGDETPEASCNAINTTGLYNNDSNRLVLIAETGARLSYR